MRNPVAFGLFIISVLIGIASVILGTTMVVESFVWAGMIIISLGVINLLVKITFPESNVPVIIEKPKRNPRKKATKRKAKKSVKRKKTKRKR